MLVIAICRTGFCDFWFIRWETGFETPFNRGAFYLFNLYHAQSYFRLKQYKNSTVEEFDLLFGLTADAVSPILYG